VVTALLVTSAATLFESAPFILAAIALTQAPLRWNARMDAYLGCGCGVGPSARSLPAAAAALLVFGPLVAGARLAAAITVDRLQCKARPQCHHRHTSLLAELQLITPIAAIAAPAVLFLPAVAGMHANAVSAFAGGAISAFVMAPCALGGVAFAATLRTAMPAAAAGFLCVAGIVDLRAWMHRAAAERAHDALAYALFALACAVVAAHHGAALLNPKLALALWPCAIAGAYAAFRFRGERCAALRIAPAVMLAGAFLAAPLPAYHATETTLADAFAGERIDFSGVLTRTGNAATLVRYAITCCRADAAPIVVRLLQPPPRTLHGWVHARGVLVASGKELRLRAESLASMDAPSDPFVYR
jgi:hypothetical protein